MSIKKIFLGIISLILISTFSLQTNGAELKNLRDLPEIKPYQEVIDKLNSELGTEISIPDNITIRNAGLNRDNIYNNILNKSLKEFEQELISQYKEFKDIINTKKSLDSEGIRVTPSEENQEIKILPLDSLINPRYINKHIIQKKNLYSEGKNIGAVDLKSEVFTAGSSGIFKYSRIIDYAHYQFKDRTHFRITSKSKCSYTLINNDETCKVKYYGALFTASGMMLTSIKIYTVTYNAS